MRLVDIEFRSYFFITRSGKKAENGVGTLLVNDSSVFGEKCVLIRLISGEKQNDAVIGHQY